MTTLLLDAPRFPPLELVAVECACHRELVPVDEIRACARCLWPFCDNHLELCDDELWRCPACVDLIPSGSLIDPYDDFYDR